jgi:hypothetical protein
MPAKYTVAWSFDQENFKEHLKFRIDTGHHLLKNNLKNTGERATYISKLTQN